MSMKIYLTEMEQHGKKYAGPNIVAETLQEAQCDAVAILFVNSYANPKNEISALKVIREIWSNEHVSASHEILPEIREFERFSTTALNAYLQPEVSGYLNRLVNSLTSGGFGGDGEGCGLHGGGDGPGGEGDSDGGGGDSGVGGDGGGGGYLLSYKSSRNASSSSTLLRL